MSRCKIQSWLQTPASIGHSKYFIFILLRKISRYFIMQHLCLVVNVTIFEIQKIYLSKNKFKKRLVWAGSACRLIKIKFFNKNCSIFCYILLEPEKTWQNIINEDHWVTKLTSQSTWSFWKSRSAEFKQRQSYISSSAKNIIWVKNLPRQILQLGC